MLMDKNSKLPHKLYNCAFAVGMLGCLQGNSCADITFAASQVICYTVYPKRFL